MPSPSWLLISFDQWRGAWLLQPWLHLPNLRRLADEGWLASHCLSASPQCVPARASWLTGQKPSRLGLDRNRPFSMPPDAPSFVRDLRHEGYHTSLAGKTHWTPHHHGVDLRDNLPLLRALGFDRALEIAGPRALAEVSCAIIDDWREAGGAGGLPAGSGQPLCGWQGGGSLAVCTARIPVPGPLVG